MAEQSTLICGYRRMFLGFILYHVALAEQYSLFSYTHILFKLRSSVTWVVSGMACILWSGPQIQSESKWICPGHLWYYWTSVSCRQLDFPFCNVSSSCFLLEYVFHSSELEVYGKWGEVQWNFKFCIIKFEIKEKNSCFLEYSSWGRFLAQNPSVVTNILSYKYAYLSSNPIFQMVLISE